MSSSSTNSRGNTDHHTSLIKDQLSSQHEIESEITEQKVLDYISNELKTDSVVRLSHINLKVLPVGSVDLMLSSNTEKLYMQKNKLSSLPENFLNLSSLKLLDMKDNSFRVFPSDFLPSSIEILDLSNNKIDSLPSNISQALPNLKYLNLRNNQFSELKTLQSLLSLKKLRILEIDEYTNENSTIKDLDLLKKFESDLDPLTALRKYFETTSNAESAKTAKRKGIVINNNEDKNLLQQQQETYLYNHSKFNDYFKRLSVLPEDVDEDYVDTTPKLNKTKNVVSSKDKLESPVPNSNTVDNKVLQNEKALKFTASSKDSVSDGPHALNTTNLTHQRFLDQPNGSVSPSFSKWNDIRNTRMRNSTHRSTELYRVTPPTSSSPHNLHYQQHQILPNTKVQADPLGKTSLQQQNLKESTEPSCQSLKSDLLQRKIQSSHKQNDSNISKDSYKQTLLSKTLDQQQGIGVNVQDTTAATLSSSQKRSTKTLTTNNNKQRTIPKSSYQQIKAIRYDRLLICCRKLLFTFTECQQTIRRMTSFGKDKTIAMNVVSLLYSVTPHIDNLVEVLEKVETSRIPVQSVVLIQSCTAIIPSFKQIFKLLKTHFESFFQGNEICFLRMFYITIMCSYTELYNAWCLIRQYSKDDLVMKPEHQVLESDSAKTHLAFSNQKPTNPTIVTPSYKTGAFSSMLSSNNIQSSQQRFPLQPVGSRLTRAASLSESPVHNKSANVSNGRQRSNTQMGNSSRYPFNKLSPLANPENSISASHEETPVPRSNSISNSKLTTSSSSSLVPDRSSRIVSKTEGASPVVQNNDYFKNLHADSPTPLTSEIMERVSTPGRIMTPSLSLQRPDGLSATSSSVNSISTASSASKDTFEGKVIIPSTTPTTTVEYPSEYDTRVVADAGAVDKQLYQLLSSVIDMTTVVTSQMNTAISNTAVSHVQDVATNETDSRTSELLAPKIKSLMKTTVTCMNLCGHMKSRLAILLTDELPLLLPAEKRKTWELINTFLKSIISLLASAKVVIKDINAFEDLRPNLGSLAKITKDVTLVLDKSSYKNASTFKKPTNDMIPSSNEHGGKNSNTVSQSQNSAEMQSKYANIFPDLKTTPSVASAMTPAMNYFDQ